MNKIVIANWKMNPQTEADALALARATDDERIILAPPTVYLEPVSKIVKKSLLCAQNMFWAENGAHTGEISPHELKDLGVQYVIVGHSERRALGETDDMVAQKIAAAFESGLTPILCVGETRAHHDAGERNAVLEREVRAAFSRIHPPGTDKGVLIAYEPIWAIGTGTPNTPWDTADAIRFIKTITKDIAGIAPTFLYGGSVNGDNAASFFAESDIGGALVGGASLNPESILAIAKAADMVL